ncbi:MAG: hypothetical protein ACOX8M_02640 [Marvinbryantia sp.]|jgi:hypothetical protein
MGNKRDIELLREIAEQYAEYAADSLNAEKLLMHRGVNDLRQIRPIVLIDEIPWNEMNYDGSLTLQCEDQVFRKYEEEMRRQIFKWKNFRADMVLQPYISVRKKIESTGIGVEIQGEVRMTDMDNTIVSHKFESQFETDEDLSKLHNPIITYNQDATVKEYEKISEAIGDLIPVKITGADTGYDLGCKSWDIIASCMNIDSLLYNLIDNPEYMHTLAEKLADIFIDTIAQYEKLNLLNGDALYVHSTAATATKLQEGMNRQHVTAQNVWGRGIAQIFSTVSPEMHEEFDITYMKKAMAPFGLVYYGCCEPLDRKIDILRQISNLRKISISPWADVNIAAEAIGKDYVLSAKPNPANLVYDELNEKIIQNEIGQILRAAEKNGCSCEIVLKDISTVKYNPQNLIRWEKVVMNMLS